jgi:hypothetical protein
MSDTKADWSQPKDVDGAALAFGGPMQKLLPPWDEIPAEFRQLGGTEWNRIVGRWFFRGLPDGTEWNAKEGVDTQRALRHLGAIMSSWEPKHEHKEAGVAYLMSLWFHSVRKWQS